MKHAKRFLALVLLLALAGCGSKEQGASAPDSETEASGSVITAQSTEEESADKNAVSGDAESKVGKRVYGNKKMYIHLISLEMTEDEGTAVLRFENRTEDETFSYKMDTVTMDLQKGTCEADTEIDALAGGETADMEVRFRKPDSGEVTLSGCSYIQFRVTVSGYWKDGDGTLGFCVKGDNETAKAMEEESRHNQSLRLTADEQDLLVDGDYKITLREIKDEVSDVGFCFEYSESGSTPALKEFYIGDTLVPEDQYDKMFSMGGGEIFGLDKELIQSMRDTLLAGDSLEVSVVFEYRLEAGAEVKQTSKLSFPVFLQ